jgi:lysozyme
MKLGALLFTLVLVGCTSPSEEITERAGDEAEAVKQCPRGERVRGVDVSYHQGRIDWEKARAHGVSFAYVRAADGAGFADPAFVENWEGARAAGVIRGAYQFFRPAQDPGAQAEVMLGALRARGGLRRGDLPPALDIEVSDGVPRERLKARALAWLARVEAATGRAPVIYTAPGFWDDLGEDPAFARYTLWVAHWETTCPTLPGGFGRWRFWQDASDGAVPGIEGPVDTDWFDGTRADLEAFAGGPAAPPPRAIAKSKPRAPRRKRAPYAPAQIDLGGLLAALPF